MSDRLWSLLDDAENTFKEIAREVNGRGLSDEQLEFYHEVEFKVGALRCVVWHGTVSATAINESCQQAVYEYRTQLARLREVKTNKRIASN